MTDIISGKIGPEASYDVNFSGGAMNVTVQYQGDQAGATLTVSVKANELISALSAKVTNPAEKSALQILSALISAT